MRLAIRSRIRLYRILRHQEQAPADSGSWYSVPADSEQSVPRPGPLEPAMCNSVAVN